jgi:hypothetical protein
MTIMTITCQNTMATCLGKKSVTPLSFMDNYGHLTSPFLARETSQKRRLGENLYGVIWCRCVRRMCLLPTGDSVAFCDAFHFHSETNACADAQLP